MTDKEPPTIHNKEPLTISGVTFEIPEGTTLSDVIRMLQDEDSEHFDDVLLKDVRIEFGSMSFKEYNERSPMK